LVLSSSELRKSPKTVSTPVGTTADSPMSSVVEKPEPVSWSWPLFQSSSGFSITQLEPSQ
jgi:hypothetical protein